MNHWEIIQLGRTRIKVFWKSLIFLSTAMSQEVKNLPETRKKISGNLKSSTLIHEDQNSTEKDKSLIEAVCNTSKGIKQINSENLDILFHILQAE